MKIVHICTSLEGGAGLCAARIIRSTRAQGIDAKALVPQGVKSEFVDVVQPQDPLSKFWLIRRVQMYLRKKGFWPKPELISKRIFLECIKNGKQVTFTSPVTFYKNITSHPWLKEADIIHLHWIGDFVDYKSFFGSIDKPVVWTIHDQNPGLGGFHYQVWKDNATDSFKAFDDELVLLKKRAYKKVQSMTLVAISTMMRDFCQSNVLLRDFPCTLIHNGIEESCFIPISKECVRKSLDLSAESTVFLFVAQDIHNNIKGLNELIQALELLHLPNVVLVCIGRYCQFPTSSFEVRCEGFISNDRLLSSYYSAADYFVMPSYQEGFAQVPMEAMACGTPVVAFPCSGAHDLINQENGVVCEDFTVDALVKGISLAMSRNYDRQQIREDVVRRFSYNVIGQQYVDLYRRILAGQKG